MAIPDPEEQVQFLFNVQRLLSEGSFVSTYKFALLHALADLSIERADDTTERLSLDTRDLAARFVALYWRQVVPWLRPTADPQPPARLRQATGGEAAILARIAQAHARAGGSLARLRQDRSDWDRLLREVARTIAVMPLWKLQTVGRARLDFLYPNVGRGHRIELRGEAIYCFRRFYELVRDLAQNAWVRFVRDLGQNRPLLGPSADLRVFLFGTERGAALEFRPVLSELQGGRCFYCSERVGTRGVVDHFVPWARFQVDLGHNLVLADAGCNGYKSDRLAAEEHLRRWWRRHQDPTLSDRFARAGLAHDSAVTSRVARWAYSLAESGKAQVWRDGRDGLVPLGPGWRAVLGSAGVAGG